MGYYSEVMIAVTKKDFKKVEDAQAKMTENLLDYVNKHDYKENNKDYNYMYLFYEVCFSYNLTASPTIDSNYLYLILELGNNKYLIDMNFTSDDILPLKENKFIKYTSNNYKKYLEVKKS